MKNGMFTSDGEVIFSDRQVAAIRMLFASLVLTPIAILKLKKVISLKDLFLLGIVGFSGNFFPAYLFTYAQNGISSGYSGMLNSFTPIFALIIGFVVFKNRLSKIQVVGVLIGTVGIVLLSIAGSDLSINGTFWHIGAVIIATLCYAISLNTIKHMLQKYSGIEITAIAFFLVLIPSVISNLYDDTWGTLLTNPHATQGLGFIAVLSVVGTAFAVYIFNVLISSSTVLFSSSVTYLIPIVAVVIGLGFGEQISIYQILSMALILFGVFVANVVPKLKAKKTM